MPKVTNEHLDNRRRQIMEAAYRCFARNGNAQAFIYRYSPGGDWEKLGGGLPQPLHHMPYALLTDPQEPGCVCAGLSSGDVWRSQDQGNSWEQLPFHLSRIHRQMIMLQG